MDNQLAQPGNTELKQALTQDLLAKQGHEQLKVQKESQEQDLSFSQEEELKPSTASSRFAALSRREQAMRKQMQDLKAREARIKEMEEKSLSPKAFAQKIKTSPLEALQEAGISMEQLVELITEGPKELSPTDALQAQIEELKAQIADSKKSYEEKQSQSYEAAINQIRHEVKNIVNSSDEFETISSLGLYENVVEHIKDTWEKEQRLIPTLEAAREIEELLLSEALKLAKINKIKARLLPQDVSDEQIQKSSFNQKPVSTQMQRTLTNATSNAQRPMSAMERAKAAFRGDKLL